MGRKSAKKSAEQRNMNRKSALKSATTKTWAEKVQIKFLWKRRRKTKLKINMDKKSTKTFNIIWELNDVGPALYDYNVRPGVK